MTTAPIHAFEDIWNDAGTLFYGIQLDVTDTASDASSKLIQLDINGSTEFSVQKDGETFIGGMLYATSGGQFVGNFSGDPVFTGDPAFTGSPDFSGVGNAATIRSDLGVAVGSDVQAWSADLDTYAANPLTAAELGELQNIGSTTISAAQWGYLGASTAFGASLLDDADAAAGRTTLDVAGKSADEEITGDWGFPGWCSFASRSDAEAGDTHSAQFLYIGDLAYVYDASGTALTTGDSRTWSPTGRITPNHWAENTTPGTTDMSSAIQAAIDYAGSFVTTATADPLKESSAKSVYFLDEEYRIDSTVTIKKEYDFLKLFGSSKSVIESAASASPALRINDSTNLYNGGDANGVKTMNGVWIDGLRFRTSAVNNQTTIGIQIGRVSDFRLTNCYLHDYWVSLDGYRMATSLIVNNRFQSSSRVSANPGLAHIRHQPIGGTQNANKPGGGIHCTDNEFIGSTTFSDAMENAILLECVDGFYLTQNHFNAFNTSHIQIAPDSSSNAPMIADVRSGGGNYFDGDNSTGCTHVLVQGDAVGTYQAIVIDGDYLRGGNTCDYGVYVAVEDGSGNIVGNRGGIQYVQVKNSQLTQHRVQGIKIEGTDTSKIPLVRPLVHANIFADGGRPATTGTSYVDIDAKGVRLTDNDFLVEDNAPTRAVALDVSNYTGVAVNISGNSFDQSSYTTEPYFVDEGTGNAVSSYGNTYANTTNGFAIGDDDEVVIEQILDEDDMSSDSDTALATQQSIKAYIDNKSLNLGSASTRTISSGTLTINGSFQLVNTEGNVATDDLDNISGGSEGEIVILKAASVSRVVTIKDGTGNLRMNGDFSLDNLQDAICFINYDGTNWHELFRYDAT